MTIKRNGFEGGTDGTAISVANSGGTNGDAFDVLVINNSSAPSGNSNLIYSAAANHLGTQGARITLQAGATYVRWNETQSGPRYVVRRSLKFPSNPTANTVLMQCHNGTAFVGSLYLNTSGAVFAASTNTTSALSGSTSSALSPNTLYYVEAAFTIETGGGGNGQIEYTVTNSAGTEIASWASAASLTIGSANVSQYRIGGSTTSTGWSTMDLDDLAAGPLASGWIGLPSNTPPSITTKPNDQDATAGATVNLTYGATDSDGTVSNSTGWSHSVVTARSTTNPSVTGSTTNTPSLTAPSAGGVVRLQSTATDNLSAVSDPVTVDIRVPKSGTIVPLSLAPYANVGTWTNTGGATNGGAALADASDSTYLQSPTVTGSVQSVDIELQPSSVRSDGDVTVRLDKTDSGTLTLNVKLYELYNGTMTLRKTWSGVTVTQTITDVVLTIDGTTISNISSWSRLILRFEATT